MYAICNLATAKLHYDANNCGTAPADVTMTYAAATNAATGMSSLAAGKQFVKWCEQANG